MVLVLVIASSWVPATRIEWSGETSEVEPFVAVNYDIADAYTKESAEVLVNRVEDHLEARREELAKSTAPDSGGSSLWNVPMPVAHE